MKLLSFLFLLALYSQLKCVDAQTIVSTQDGNWEDSTTWGGISIADTLDHNTVIVRHHVNFNNNMYLRNCYLEIDTFASICGHDSIHIYNSTVYAFGGTYAERIWVEKSYWYYQYGYWVFIDGFRISNGPAGFHNCCGAGGHTGGGFVCSIPVESWIDTIQADTTHTDTIHQNPPPPPPPPLSISVYHSPTFDYFTVSSEIPDSTSQVSLDIFDLLGRRIKTISVPAGKSTLSVYTNDWPAGMYILKFADRDKIIQSERIIRMR